MIITKKDVAWNFVATIFKIGSSILLLPLILRRLPSEEVGIWIIYSSISGLVLLLDFGFTPSFTRNITYILSGVKELKKEGISEFIETDNNVDYGLLASVINAMRWFYLRISILLFLIIGIFGTYYISVLLEKYSGNVFHVYISWVLLVLITTYGIYTQYYDSLLLGKGLVKRAKQITITAQVAYLAISSILILAGYGLIAIVAAQSIAVVITRFLSYKIFFVNNMIVALQSAKPIDQRIIIKAIYPNAIKLGVTSLGGYLVSRSAVIIGSLYLSLSEIASYGISIQIITILASTAGIYTSTYFPKMADLRVANNIGAIKGLYIRGIIASIAIFFFCGIVLIVFGNSLLHIIGSRTSLLGRSVLAVALTISFLEMNHSLAGSVLLTKNEVPFYKHSIIAGLITVSLLVLFFQYFNLGIWGMVLAPGIAHLYNNWKWPHEVFKELNISFKDIYKTLIELTRNKLLGIQSYAR